MPRPLPVSLLYVSNRSVAYLWRPFHSTSVFPIFQTDLKKLLSQFVFEVPLRCILTTFAGEFGCEEVDLCTCVSPVIVDTDGSGIRLTDSVNGVLFDIAGDGKPIQLSWTAAGTNKKALENCRGKAKL